MSNKSFHVILNLSLLMLQVPFIVINRCKHISIRKNVYVSDCQIHMGENMGNVMISSFKNTEEIQPEWLIDSQQRFILDLSRKVSHNQYLKVNLLSNIYSLTVETSVK